MKVTCKDWNKSFPKEFILIDAYDSSIKWKVTKDPSSNYYFISKGKYTYKYTEQNIKQWNHLIDIDSIKTVNKEDLILEKIKYLNNKYESRNKEKSMPTMS